MLDRPIDPAHPVKTEMLGDRLSRVTLGEIGLSSEDAANRSQFIGGSDARIIASGNQKKILDLWEIKCGLSEGEDFSNRLDVLMGSWTETLNRLWYQRKTGNSVYSVGAQFTSARYPFMGASLDGIFFTEDSDGIFEAKHVNGFKFDLDETVRFYMPQLQHNMAVCGLDMAHLSVIYGSSGWKFAAVAADPFYQARLIALETEFWQAVTTRTPPGELKPPEMPLTHAELRTVDMMAGNAKAEWEAHATAFILTKDAAKRFEDYKKAIKALVPNDAVKAHGAGIEVRRSVDRALTVYVAREKAKKPAKTKK